MIFWELSLSLFPADLCSVSCWPRPVDHIHTLILRPHSHHQQPSLIQSGWSCCCRMLASSELCLWNRRSLLMTTFLLHCIWFSQHQLQWTQPELFGSLVNDVKELKSSFLSETDYLTWVGSRFQCHILIMVWSEDAGHWNLRRWTKIRRLGDWDEQDKYD